MKGPATITLAPESLCSGCSACFAACPVSAIRMRADREGFPYPAIDPSACIACHACERVCPVLHRPTPQAPLSVWAAVNPDEPARAASSSGGAFTLLARRALREGAVVYGAGWSPDFRVVHRAASDEDGLAALRGSKYVQSDLGETFREILGLLAQGRDVLFSGTPCQVAGLRALASQAPRLGGGAAGRLTCVDLICHAVPSPLAFAAYTRELEARFGAPVSGVSFRDKSCGWKRFSMAVTFASGAVYRAPLDQDPFLLGFLKELINRPSCGQCSFRELRSGADLTLADYWQVHTTFSDLDDDRGVSLVLANTARGQQLLEEAQAATGPAPSAWRRSDYADVLRTNSAVCHSPRAHKRRAAFFARLRPDEPVTPLLARLLRPSLSRRWRALWKRPRAEVPATLPAPAETAAPARVGILTLLNQLNYGGVLQAFALQRALLSRGVDTELVDYWLAPRNEQLWGYYLDPSRPLFKRVLRAARHALKRGAYYIWADIARRRKTVRFLRERVRLSPRPYRSADELRGLARYATLIVGSDQVWNYQWHGRPNPFLLTQAGAAVRRVSYAASFGFGELPPEHLAEYREALGKFDSLSVREHEGVGLVRAWTGREAQWVLDPTLLLPEAEWRALLGDPPPGGPYVFCYWLGDLRACLKMLRALPRPGGEKVRLHIPLQQLYGRRKPADWLLRLQLLALPFVRLCCAAGPLEYVSGIAHAQGVVSDSFHALMFACQFRKPVKIFVNTAAQRARMSARMTDFAERYQLCGAVEAEVPEHAFALARPDYEAVWRALDADRARSLSFLERALA
jgi:coenzyme F420-reducing hydrogenase beta subunit